MKKIIIGIVLLAAVVGASTWFWVNSQNQPASFRTVQVEVGDLRATISATGTIEPEEVVDVGAQVVGQIKSLGEDPRSGGKFIDYGSLVEKGTELAHIDDSVYQAQLDRAKAQVEQSQAALDSAIAQVASADANVKRAEADLGQMQAKLYQAERDWQRYQRLGSTKSVSDADYDTAEATYRTAKATLAVGEATIAQTKAALKDAQANVAKAQATLVDAKANQNNAQINLDYCTIKSPVKGVIVDRRVNVGQTVVSSLNAPSLFLIAKDLKKLQVWASVNEADIGNIHSGQTVTFSVDAYPGRVFTGTVAPDQPRLNASMTQNVVTYTVVVNTDNSDGKLLPYLTANLQFEVDKRSKVLLVPNSALRWKPNPQQVVPEARDDFVNKQRSKAKAPADDPQAAPAEKGDKATHNRGTLWVQDGNFVRPVKVTTGLTDGLMTEIVKGDVAEGAAVVVGENRTGDAGGTKNPFMPSLFRGNSNNKQQ
jgi:HlyD family secretion protein